MTAVSRRATGNGAVHASPNAHRVLTKEQIGRYVRGDHRGDDSSEQLVSRLRRKVDRDAPGLIRTRRGFGHWFGYVDAEHRPAAPGGACAHNSLSQQGVQTPRRGCDLGHVSSLSGN
ncbi:winged helix-turn-helix domain-containing protein [Streptomyces shenzhenensis]|uniref:winged helix-turn-helix domain-containing protein n=1 Tax=Streptomyces shenzhenensis TaxID=943815 RepID=UPI0035579ED0